MTDAEAMAPPAAPRTPRSGARRWLRRIVVGVLLVIVAAGVLGSAYFAIPQRDLPEAAAALRSTAEVSYALEDGRLVFEPAAGPATTGLILYPGGKVDAAAYAPAAAAIAAEGYLVEIVPMPLNLAVLGIDRADAVIAAHPEVRIWAIGGHSLGGAMAAQYVSTHPGRIHGLVLWASYSAVALDGDAEPSLRTLLVYGSLDVGAGSFTKPSAIANLGSPPTIVVIEGGNHEQMGWYTGQPNDPPATISREAQQAQLVEATVEFLATLGGDAAP